MKSQPDFLIYKIYFTLFSNYNSGNVILIKTFQKYNNFLIIFQQSNLIQLFFK